MKAGYTRVFRDLFSRGARDGRPLFGANTRMQASGFSEKWELKLQSCQPILAVHAFIKKPRIPQYMCDDTLFLFYSFVFISFYVYYSSLLVIVNIK